MGDMPEQTSTTVTEGRVRRVPRYGVFLVSGGALGILIAAILTLTFDGIAAPSEIGVTYSQSQVFGFLMLYCAAGGVMLGAIVALILDKTVGRRTHAVKVQTEKVVETPEAA